MSWRFGFDAGWFLGQLFFRFKGIARCGFDGGDEGEEEDRL
jgi:hypothetical protein